ncbi:unnamed protein product, partial [Rotaria sp. Silwood2]
MGISKKQQIRGVRILLTVFYGFLLSSVLFGYIIHGIVETVRRPTNLYAIIMIVIGVLILIFIVLAIYAIWFDNIKTLLVSGIVLICVFIFGIVRIINTESLRIATAPTVPKVLTDDNKASYAVEAESVSKATATKDTYALIEDVTKLIIELIAILVAIFAAFFLFRYVKTKYSQVPISETTSS